MQNPGFIYRSLVSIELLHMLYHLCERYQLLYQLQLGSLHFHSYCEILECKDNVLT